MATLSLAHRDVAIKIFFVLLMHISWVSDVAMEGNINESVEEEILVVSRMDDIFFEIVHPTELEYTYRIRPAQDFGMPFTGSFSERRIPLVPVEPETGCRRPNNADKLKDSVALVWRGDCSFFLKAVVAEDAGAKAIIVADYPQNSIDEERESPLWRDHEYIEMASDNDIALTRTVNIPAGFLLGKNGRIIRETLRRLNLQSALINIPVNLTFASITQFHQPPWVTL